MSTESFYFIGYSVIVVISMVIAARELSLVRKARRSEVEKGRGPSAESVALSAGISIVLFLFWYIWAGTYFFGGNQ